MAGEPARGVEVGDRLDKYLLIEKLGEGGMGVVFLGRHEGLGREVAVKLLREQYARNEGVMARFQREAEAVSRIGHPNIVAVYDFGRAADGSQYYVMERVRGETLRARLERGPALSDDELVVFFGALCRALGAAHAVGIVHRDLKPDNVLLQEQPEALPHVKVLDFGVAKVLEPERGAALTSAGSLIGTPTYMAPEQVAAAQRVDGRADLYSLGAMLYVCLTGRPPFVGDAMAVLMAHLRDPVPPPSTANPIRPVSPALEAMVLRALAKEPEGRPQDAAAFLAELEAALERSRPARPVATSAPARRDRDQAGGGTRRLMAIGGGLLVAVVALAVVVGGGRGRSRPAAESVPTAPATATATPSADAASRAAALVAAALDGSAEDRRTVLETMGDVADRRALPAIVRGLGDDNPAVRRAAAAAAAATGQPGDRALVEALAEAAQRSGGAIAVEIAAARLRLGDAGAAELLRPTLDGPDAALALRAAVALAERDQLAAPRLRRALAAAPPTVRRPLRWAAFVELRRLGDRAFAGELDRALAGDDSDAKLDAAVVLAGGGDPRAQRALSALAAHATDAATQREARRALAELGDASAFAALAAASRDPSPAVRAAVAATLARLGRAPARSAAVRAALAPLLDDPEREPRLVAAAALFVGAPSTQETP